MSKQCLLVLQPPLELRFKGKRRRSIQIVLQNDTPSFLDGYHISLPIGQPLEIYVNAKLVYYSLVISVFAKGMVTYVLCALFGAWCGFEC